MILKTGNFRDLLIIFLKTLTIGVALLMIPVILLVSVFLPWRGNVSFFLFILPLVLLVLWIIRMILCGRLRRKESPAPFYTVLIASGLFLNENQKRQLFKDYGRFYVTLFLPFLGNQNDIRILNYHVKSFDFFDTAVLFQEVFIYQQYFFKATTPTPWIIDCGSHIGISILYFKALYPQARLLGFEPAPETFKLLSENVKNNRLKNVRLENKAVSNVEGRLEFCGDKSKTSSLIKERGSGEGTEADVVKSSQYIDREVSFLKLDVEGVEDLVLEDLAAAEKLKMIQQMVIEYHHHFIGDEDRLSRFLKIFEDHNFGYQIEGSSEPPYNRMESENIMIYAYRK